MNKVFFSNGSRSHAFRKAALLALLLAVAPPLQAQKQAQHRSIDMNRAQREHPQTMPVAVNGEVFEMVLVQGGMYMMGCEPLFWNNTGRKDEIPRHSVSLGNFYLGRYEVTQRLWRAVMGDNPSNFVGDDNPVEQVSYSDALRFIARLDSLTGYHFRLPTEAEWEFAARGGMLSEGHPYAGSNRVEEVAWMSDNSEMTTHPVGELSPNELGLYDMTGNVWEWCSDWYGAHTYLFDVAKGLALPDVVSGYDGLTDWLMLNQYEHYAYEAVVNTVSPKGADTGDCRVGRGGSWADRTGGDNGLRVAYRNFWDPEKRISVVGFRLALGEEDLPADGWMPNQYVMDSADGKFYAVRPEALIRASQGLLEGLFSVSETRQVRFSRGNLQYNAVRQEWRFANHQYEVVGEDNLKYSKKYAGWIDLFAWGTSGHHNRPPYYFAAVNTAYGNGQRNIEGSHYDWGLHNAISNGGNAPGLWRTLSVNEWAYLLMRRPDAFFLCYAASIDGHEGMVLLPDDWLASGGDTVNPAVEHLYTSPQWSEIERAGAVFLPCAGFQKINIYRFGYPVEGEPKVELMNVGFGIVPPRTLEKVSEAAKYVDPAARALNNENDNQEPLPEYANGKMSEEAMFDQVAQRDYLMKAAFREAREMGALGYYWTTVHYGKDYAMGFGFNYGSRGYIMPFERLTRLAVRLVQDVR